VDSQTCTSCHNVGSNSSILDCSLVYPSLEIISDHANAGCTLRTCCEIPQVVGPYYAYNCFCAFCHLHHHLFLRKQHCSCMFYSTLPLSMSPTTRKLSSWCQKFFYRIVVDTLWMRKQAEGKSETLKSLVWNNFSS